MRLVTVASLGASAALGLGALFLARTTVPEPNRAVAAPPAPIPNAVSVVVAAKAIPYGTVLDASQLRLVRTSADAAPDGAFSSIEQALAQDHGGPPVVLTPIANREALLPAKLSGPGARPSVAAEIAPGLRAYTIRVSDVSGVGGHALPGDHVDVVLMRDLSPGGDRKVLTSEVVLQDVRVLGVDLNADLTSNKPAAPTTATLEVSVRDAQKLAVSSELGALSLALRPAGATAIEKVTPMLTRDVGGAPAPNIGRRRPVDRAAARAGIIVVEGDGTSSAKPAAGSVGGGV